jgi:hypothetical protein
MSVGIVEVNAVIVAGSAAHDDAGSFQDGCDALVVASADPQRKVIHLVASMQFVMMFEQPDHLAATLQKAVAGKLVRDTEAEKIHVEASCPFEVAHMQHDVIDSTYSNVGLHRCHDALHTFPACLWCEA